MQKLISMADQSKPSWPKSGPFKIRYRENDDSESVNGLARDVLADVATADPNHGCLTKFNILGYLCETLEIEYKTYQDASNRLHTLLYDFELPDEIFANFRIRCEVKSVNTNS